MSLTVLFATDAYTTLCSVRADTSKLVRSMQPHHLPDGGGTYYSILFYVVLLFGLTELKAQISWIDNVRLCMDLLPTLLALTSGVRLFPLGNGSQVSEH